MTLAGVDGCRTGWLCVVQRDSEVHVTIAPALDPWLHDTRPDLVVIDMPIGLPATGRRRCDTLARVALRPRRMSSLFPAPVRAVLSTSTYADACAIHRAVDGRALSKQTFFLLHRICELDDLLQRAAGLRDILHEGHPELSFATWNDGVPMSHPKRTPEGRRERQRHVDAVWPGAIERWRSRLPRSAYAEDDLLDAFAVLWTARRLADGSAVRRPDPPDHDATGLAMVIAS